MTYLAMVKGRPGEVYNVGTGISTDFNTIFRIVKEETGFDGDPAYVENPPEELPEVHLGRDE